jgi:glucose/arabinose dehydrogenase
MTAVPGDNTRLFVVEQGGRIQIFDVTTKSVRATFLDISSSGSNLISSGGERGLLGIAFDPSYNTNRRFYVYYTDISGNIVIARYLRDQNNPDLADSGFPPVVLLTIPHPGQANHNGGMLAFGPDGCLFAGPGDGGGAGDPGNNGQNPNVRLGKLLRVDPSTGGACTFGTTNPFSGGGGDPLIWSLGLRNPWRFSFDRQTGDLYIADVGQDTLEEIDISLAVNGGGKGLNFGWNIMEGSLCFPIGSPCTQNGLTLPALDYDHSQGACAIIGGYVYRGSAMPALTGTYFYGDLCAGFVRSLRNIGGQVTQQNDWPLLSLSGNNITSFGEDASGELYLMTSQGGLFRIVPN